MSPIVSIVIPCYNSAQTLPFAISSVITQTFSNWECLIVDDGSDDPLDGIVKQFNDPRIKLFRLTRNSGRANARQFALEKATGEFLAMVDADDWIYPDKLQLQLEEFDRNPALTLVSSMVAIFESNTLAGIRGALGENIRYEGTLNTFTGSLPVIHAASLIRMSEANNFRYDPRNIIGEDTDFLLKLLWGKQFCIINKPLYAYNEVSSYNLKKLLTGYATSRRLLLIHKSRFFAFYWLQYWIKSCTVVMLKISGLLKKVMYGRTIKADIDEQKRFSDALKSISLIYEKLPQNKNI